MTDPIRPFLEEQGFLVLDGGLATELEFAGFDLDAPRDAPSGSYEERLERIERLHRRGLLTDEEYREARRRIVEKL